MTLTWSERVQREMVRDPRGIAARAQAELARRSGSRSFSSFVKQAWPIFEPAPLVWGWHVDAVCQHLEAVARGEIRRLVINVPPRSAKSNLAAISFAPWVWISKPRTQFMYISYSSSLSVEHSIKSRQIIESQWYKEHYRAGWELRSDQNVKHDFVNTLGGRRRATSIDAGITGHGADLILIDDPINADEAYSKASREKSWRVCSEAISTRFNDPKTGRAVVIMQRFHEDDVSERLIKQGGWEHLMLPTEFEIDRRSVTYHVIEKRNGHVERIKQEFWRDPRTVDGELLFPERIPREEVERFKVSLGPFAYSAQHQQRPSPEGGGMFKVDKWRYWTSDDVTLTKLGYSSTDALRPRGAHDGPARSIVLDELDEVLISVDATFRETKTGSFVVIQVWGKQGARRLLLEEVRARMDFTESVNQLMRVINRWDGFILPHARRKLIEGKANGDAIISTLERQHGVIGLEAVNPGKGSKADRAAAGSPYQAAGNVELPAGALWLADYVAEFSAFPNGAADDRVDAQSQALLGFEQVPTAMDAWLEIGDDL